MSSNRLGSTVDNACALVEARLRDRPGVGRLLENIRGKFLSGSRDPLEDRELIYEPWIVAQQLDVPRVSAELVAHELQKIGILRIWTRFLCPSPIDEGENVVLETDSADQVEPVLRGECPCCGRQHELNEFDIEVFYAPNFKGLDSPAPFVSPKPDQWLPDASEFQVNVALLRLILASGLEPGSTIGNALTPALESNTAVQCVPSPTEGFAACWNQVCFVATIGFVSSIVAACLVGVLFGLMLLIIDLVVCLCMMWSSVAIRRAPSALERSIATGGHVISFATVGSGIWGGTFSVKGSPDKFVDFDISTGPDYLLVAAGVLVWFFTMVGLYFIQKNKGWA